MENSPVCRFSDFTRCTFVKSEPTVTFICGPWPFTAFSSLPGRAVARDFADRSQRGSYSTSVRFSSRTSPLSGASVVVKPVARSAASTVRPRPSFGVPL